MVLKSYQSLENSLKQQARPDLFMPKVNVLKSVRKSCILDVSQCCKYASGRGHRLLVVIEDRNTGAATGGVL